MARPNRIIKLVPEFGPRHFCYKPSVMGMQGLLVNNKFHTQIGKYSAPSLTTVDGELALERPSAGDDWLQYTVNYPWHTFTGDFTAIVRARCASAASQDETWSSSGEFGESSWNNIVWSIGIDVNDMPFMFFENGNGANNYPVGDAVIGKTLGEVATYGFSRNAAKKTVTYFKNGSQVGSEISYANNATDGTSTKLAIGSAYNATGDSSDYEFTDVIISAKVLPHALIKRLTTNIDLAYIDGAITSPHFMPAPSNVPPGGIYGPLYGPLGGPI